MKNLLSRMQKEIKDVADGYGMDIIPVEWNSRIKAAGVFTYKKLKFSKVVKPVRICMSAKLYKEFGEERVWNTFWHEVAHWIVAVFYPDKTGHSEEWKTLCIDLGGEMNSHLAGTEDAEYVATDYPKYARTYYTCKCGLENSFGRRLGNLKASTYGCGKCRILFKDMKITREVR